MPEMGLYPVPVERNLETGPVEGTKVWVPFLGRSSSLSVMVVWKSSVGPPVVDSVDVSSSKFTGPLSYPLHSSTVPPSISPCVSETYGTIRGTSNYTPVTSRLLTNIYSFAETSIRKVRVLSGDRCHFHVTYPWPSLVPFMLGCFSDVGRSIS